MPSFLFFGLLGLFGFSALLNLVVFIYSWSKYHKQDKHVWPIPLTAAVLVLLMVCVYVFPCAWNLFFAQTPESIVGAPTLVVVAVVVYSWSKYHKQDKPVWLILSTASILVMLMITLFLSIAVWNFAHTAG
jgi:hypothetical protein